MDGSGPSRSFRWWQLLGAASFCAAVFFAGLGATRLWDRDEPRNAGCAAEMLQQGDWIVPVFNDQLRVQKPVLTYWLMMSAYSVFGVHEFSARFWSAALGVLTCLMTWRIGTHLFDSRSGLLAALILPGTVMFTVASRAATPDAPLIFCSTAALLWYVERTWSRQSPASGSGPARLRFGTALGLYAILGVGALAKGLAGVIPPLAVIGLFRIVCQVQPRRRMAEESIVLASARSAGHWLTGVVSPLRFTRALLSLRPVLGLFVILAVAGPWFAAVGWATEGEFLRQFFLREHLQRATAAMEGHDGGLWFYPLAVLAGFFPWSVFAVPVWLESSRESDPARRRAIAFLVCWVGVIIGLFSLASTKLPSYVTPCYPALALLTGHAMTRLAEGVTRIGWSWYRGGILAAAACGLAISIGLWIVGDRLVEGHRELAWIPLPILVAAVVIGVRELRRREPAGINPAGPVPRGPVPMGLARDGVIGRWLVRVYPAAAALFVWLLLGFGAQVVDSTRRLDPVLDAIRDHAGSAPIAAYRCLESSWVYYGRQPILELAVGGEPGAVSADRRRDWEPLPRLSPDRFAELFPGNLVLTTDQHLPELRAQLGSDVELLAGAPDFLKDRNLVLVRVGVLLAGVPLAGDASRTADQAAEGVPAQRR